MCGRFTLTKDEFDDVVADLDAIVRPEYADEYRALYKPRYNIAPTDQHWILRSKYEERQLLPAKWGLVNSWADDMKRAAAQINARSESASTKICSASTRRFSAARSPLTFIATTAPPLRICRLHNSCCGWLSSPG